MKTSSPMHYTRNSLKWGRYLCRIVYKSLWWFNNCSWFHNSFASFYFCFTQVLSPYICYKLRGLSGDNKPLSVCNQSIEGSSSRPNGWQRKPLIRRYFKKIWEVGSSWHRDNCFIFRPTDSYFHKNEHWESVHRCININFNPSRNGAGAHTYTLWHTFLY